MALLIVTLYLAYLTGALGQTFHFENITDQSDAYGSKRSHDWAVKGSVKLTKEDFEVFQPKVVINVVEELCTVDLNKCPPKDLPSTPTVCHCLSHTGDNFNIHIGTKTTPAQGGKTVQAVVPGHGILSNIQGAATIGTLPNITEKGIGATYRVDGGSSHKLLPAQTLITCPDMFVTVEVCLDKPQPGAVLQMAIDDVSTVSLSRQTCVHMSYRYRFESQPSHTLTFSDQKSENSTLDNTATFTILENKQSCLPSRTSAPSTNDRTTTAAPSTTEVPTTSTATTTTPSTTGVPTTTTSIPSTTEVLTTTPAPPSIEGVCSDRQRSLTTEPYGRQALVDTVSFGQSWVVFQRRVSGSVNFERSWYSYENGFGSVNDSYWLGLNSIRGLCNFNNRCELLVHVEWKDQPYDDSISRSPQGCYYARYDYFWVDGADYKLYINGYSGTAGDMLSGDLRNLFTTTDRNDYNSYRCAISRRGGWWYDKSSSCSRANLNGIWQGSGLFSSMTWNSLTGSVESVSFSEMKLRRQ